MAPIMALGLRPLAIMVAFRPIPRPYHYNQSLTYNFTILGKEITGFQLDTSLQGSSLPRQHKSGLLGLSLEIATKTDPAEFPLNTQKIASHHFSVLMIFIIHLYLGLGT